VAPRREVDGHGHGGARRAATRVEGGDAHPVEEHRKRIGRLDAHDDVAVGVEREIARGEEHAGEGRSAPEVGRAAAGLHDVGAQRGAAGAEVVAGREGAGVFGRQRLVEAQRGQRTEGPRDGEGLHAPRRGGEVVLQRAVAALAGPTYGGLEHLEGRARPEVPRVGANSLREGPEVRREITNISAHRHELAHRRLGDGGAERVGRTPGGLDGGGEGRDGALEIPVLRREQALGEAHPRVVRQARAQGRELRLREREVAAGGDELGEGAVAAGRQVVGGALRCAAQRREGVGGRGGALGAAAEERQREEERGGGADVHRAVSSARCGRWTVMRRARASSTP
jgi:hypothetical protein